MVACDGRGEDVRSRDQVRHVEPRLLRCPRWWSPGVIVIGDFGSHLAMDPAWQRMGEIRNSADRPAAEAWPPVE